METRLAVPSMNHREGMFPQRTAFPWDVGWIAAAALAYFLIARFSLLLTFQPEGIAAIWPPSGVFLSCILLTRRRLRPFLVGALFSADLAAETLAGIPFQIGVVYSSALAGDAVFSSWLLLRFVGDSIDFRRVRVLSGFLVLSVFLSNAVTSLAAAAAAEMLPGSLSFWNSWRLWATSDGIGNLLVTPLILNWASRAYSAFRKRSRGKWAEAALLFIPLVMLNLWVFRYESGFHLFFLLLPYMTFPFLLWAALRFGMRGVSVASIALTGIAVGYAVAGRLHLSVPPSTLDDVLLIQMYAALLAMPSMFLAALVAERSLAEIDLRRASRGLRMISECNEALVRINTIAELIATICRLIVQHGGYCMSWIGLAEKNGAGEFLIDARAGFPEGCVEAGVVPEGGVQLEAIKDAIRTSRPSLCRDLPSASPPASGTGAAARSRATSFLALPLPAEEHALGALVVYADYPAAFNNEELALLDELARDLSYGIKALNTRAERASAEEALKEQNRYIETILENAPIGFAVNTIHDGKVVFVSRKFEEIYGVPHKGIRTAEEFFEKVYVDPDFREKIKARVIADLASGDPARMRWEDIPLTTAAGEKRYVTAINIPLSHQDLMVSTVQDVTARHLAVETLRESEERFRTLVETAPEAIVVQADHRFVYLNPRALNLFGARTPGELLGQLLEERFTAQCRNRLLERLRILNEERRPLPPAEMECVRLDGGILNVEMTPVPIVYEGKNGSLAFLRDLTEHLRLEQKLREAQKMEAIGQLAGGVAHDFNNILAATMLNLGLLQENRNLDTKTREGLKELEADARRAVGLTRQLLMFSRRSVLEVKVHDLNEIVANLLKMVGRLIGEHIELQMHRKTARAFVEADAGMLEQVLMNLSVNARDAMPGGGRITIITEMVVIDEELAKVNPDRRPGRFACLSVADTGCGMDENTLKRIFEPFFTTKAPGKGTGLGLPTVYGIVAQHKGWVEVESQVGSGTTFRIFIPSATGHEPAPAEVSGALAAAGHETILLVEDEQTVRRTTAQVLRVLGYSVFEAENGKEAMKMWQTHGRQIDLLFTDMVMPEGIMGLDLVKKLRAERPDLKVIISSGYSTEFTGPARLSVEEVVYLPKPYEIGILGKTVRECLDGK